MPRDASDTRARLLREAERLFASQGVYRATVREITLAAGQRNASALAYHFGSRTSVLWAILRRHGDPLDVERGGLLEDPIESMATRDLVAALLVPYARRLATDEGRDYLRIIAQLTDLFPVWRVGELSPPKLRRILEVLEARAGSGDRAVRQDRVVGVVMLMTAAIAERARGIEEGGRLTGLTLEEPAFVANLADMIVAALEAPAGLPLAAPREQVLVASAPETGGGPHARDGSA